MGYNLSVILIAYILDLIIGDPQWQWHPVRIIGKLTAVAERNLNTAKFNKKFCGIILVILVVGLTAFCIWAVLKLSKSIHPILYYILSVVFVYFALSVKSLAVEANKVYRALQDKNIQEARKNLSMIVARDTKNLEESEVIRASVETVAESIMDGIVAPLFYAFLGGPVLVWVYKAINTLDSMVGYRSERFIDFGKASAKLDGIANFIPAKITCFLIGLSSLCYGKNWLYSVKWGLKYFSKAEEFNSVATEAAMAGALGIRLGGLNFYNSFPIQKPFIGDNIFALDKKHITESIKISYACSALVLVFGMITVLLIKKL